MENFNNTTWQEPSMEPQKNAVVETESHTPASWQKFVAVLLIVASIAGFFFLIQPSRAYVNDNSAKLSELNTQEEALKARLSMLQGASDSLGLNSEVKTEQILNAIPQKLDQDKLITDLVAIAKKNDIQFQSLGFGIEGQSDDEVKKVTVNASFEGNYSSLIHFLKAVEQNGRKMVVDNISVQMLGEALNGVERVHFALTLVSFYRDGI